ncbi:hypothetical protein [Bacillus sp. 166amftsu]|uniref:hypothetical protein n=1 Tax=Bacillus sp. 166amftsu TaxID=1761753 RepID=UPI00089D7D44|nr:hypothetical protein [Bacillus sp. 166amftsu]SDY58066.1 Protein of unknown function [Bacillus sp. 166amftsu]
MCLENSVFKYYNRNREYTRNTYYSKKKVIGLFTIVTACIRNEKVENEHVNVQQQTEKGAMEGYVMMRNETVYFIMNKKSEMIEVI